MWEPLIAGVARKARESGDPLPGRWCVPVISDGDAEEKGLPWLFCFMEIAAVCRKHGAKWTQEALAYGLEDAEKREACEAIIADAFATEKEWTAREAKEEFKRLREGKDKEDEAAAVSLVMMLAFGKEG